MTLQELEKRFLELKHLYPYDVMIMWNEIVNKYGGRTVSMIHKDYGKAAYGIGIVTPP